MIGAKTEKIVLGDSGAWLGMEKGCFLVRDKQGKEKRFPLFEKEIGEVVLKSGNSVSTGALASLGFWDIDVMIMTQRGRPVAMLKGLDDDSHVGTRIAQYEAVKSPKGIAIAKQLILSKTEGRNVILKKYGLKTCDVRGEIERLPAGSLEGIRRRLVSIEGRYDIAYFRQVFGLIPERIRPEARRAFKAFSAVNNLFNLAYEMLGWKVHRALIRAKLEPYLGFVHSLQWEKPSLVCDFMELYRYLIDDFVIQYCQTLTPKDFVMKDENAARGRKGKREYLNDSKTKEFMDRLNAFFEDMVEVPRINVGERQTIETLINEEALLFAKYLRGETAAWVPRLAA